MEENLYVEDNPNIEETPNRKNNLHMNKKKKVIVLAGITVILVIVLAVIGSISTDTFFQDLLSETLDEHPYTVGLGCANDGSYMIFSINPNIPAYKTLGLKDTLGALKYINKELGFTPALYEKMVNTTSEMGVQIDSNSKFEVTWTYSSESGLYVIYERN